MDEIAERSIALTAAPLGCAFLLEVERSRRGAEAVADPVVSFHLLGRAINDVTVWRVDHPSAVARFLAEGPRLRPLALAVLDQPATAGWFGPLDRRRQLLAATPAARPRMGLVTSPTEASVLVQPVVPNRPPTEWERYAQFPHWGVYTSTEADGVSSFLVGASASAGDLGPLKPPVARYLLAVSAAARVFEVDGPDAWHRLCVSYPAPEEGGLRGGLTVPDFGAAARDWNAVHLTLGGLMAADQVRVGGPAGRTELQGWDAEQTVWLRPAFDGAIRLPDLLAEIAEPVDL